MKKILSLLIGCLLMTGVATAQTAEGGWLESCWMEFNMGAYSTYVGYVSADNGNTWTKLDKELVRQYSTIGRVDAVGLTAGSYLLKVVPVSGGVEQCDDAITSESLEVRAYDRHGFAHTGAYTTTGIGAYNNDGTLKTNARVLYVTAATAKTVQLAVKTNNKGAETTYTGLQRIIIGYQKGYEDRPLDVRIVGTINVANLDTLGSKEEGLQIKGRNAYSVLNITMEGIGKDAAIKGFGILCRNAQSVEFRNFGILNCMDDCLSLDTENSHVWVHNMDFYYGKAGSDSDQAKGDGTVDIKGNSQHVTVSYNHFFDSGKSSLCGMTSESGPNYITYHHNWFDHSDSRHPRIRTMSVHVYNNYYDGNAKYGVGATMGSSVFVESNYFRNCSKPMLISKQGTDVHMGIGTSDQTKGTFSGEAGGIIKSFGNVYTGSYTLVTYQQNSTHFDCWEASNRNDMVPASVTALLGSSTYDNFDTQYANMYSVTPDAAANVPGIVTGDYGAGRLQHGDLPYAFNNSTDDADYNVNATLKNSIVNYTSSLTGIIGTATAADCGGTPVTPDPEDPGTDPDPSDPGTDPEPATPVSSEYEWSADTNGKTHSFYTISGNLSNSKGTVTYDGTTYSNCLKMESATSIAFSLAEDVAFTLVFGSSETASIKVDGTVTAATGNVLTFNLSAGAHEFKKSTSVNLFYMNAAPLPVVGQLPALVEGYTRTFGTFCSMHNWTVTSDGVHAYKAALNAGGDAIVLTELSGVIPAYAGVILASETSADSYTITCTSADATADVTGNILHGTVVQMTHSELLAANPGYSNILYLSTNAVFRVLNPDGGRLAAHRAYLPWSDVQAPNRFIIADYQPIATGMCHAATDAVVTAKRLVNGKLVIIREGKMFNVNGQVINY